MGRNVVFSLAGKWAVKVVPPQWLAEAKREMSALNFVAGRIRLSTPDLVYQGELHGWYYLVTRWLAGHELYKLWPVLKSDQKMHVAYQMGEAAGVFHSLRLTENPRNLEVHWSDWLADQRRDSVESLQRSGLSAQLVEDLPRFLEAVGPLPVPDLPNVFLHGDLNIVNMLVAEDGNHWKVTGICDFGDAKIGQAAHDFISPAIHVFLGDATQLKAFYEGYGLTKAEMTREFESHLMARTILWYGGEYLNKRLDQVPQTGPRDTWEQVAYQYWHMSEAA